MDSHFRALPKIAIVGRPNVGKSALFNRICQKKISIVDEVEGVTRDRIYAKGDYFGKPFALIDTGGLDTASSGDYTQLIRQQTEIAIEEADRLIFVVDAVVGVTPLDEEVAKMLRRRGKPVILAINKIDDESQELLVHRFHSLGIEKMVAVSAAHGFQIEELLETTLDGIEEKEVVNVQSEQGIKVAIVGRANVGKSTLLNYLLKEQRSMVSPIAGTTRDSIDATLTIDGQIFTLIDTAGIRRKKSEAQAIEKFAAIRTERAIERADICILVLSSLEGITAQEKRIAKQIEEKGKGCILLFNKWDLARGFKVQECLKDIEEEATFLNYCPRLFVSAKEGKNLDTLFQTIKEVYAAAHVRISTGQLNKFLEKTMQLLHPPSVHGKRLRIYYISQISIAPPRFIFFVNSVRLMVDSYQKYLINHFRQTYGFSGVPLFFSLRGKTSQSLAERLAADVRPLA